MINFNKFDHEILRYLIVGILAILIDYLTYSLSNFLFEFSFSISKKISFILGASWSFYMNKIYTFKKNSFNLKEPILFVIIYLISYLINTNTHDLLIISYSSNFSFTVATFFSVIWNFLGQKLIVFK